MALIEESIRENKYTFVRNVQLYFKPPKSENSWIVFSINSFNWVQTSVRLSGSGSQTFLGTIGLILMLRYVFFFENY